MSARSDAYTAIALCGLAARCGCRVIAATAHAGRPMVRVDRAPDPRRLRLRRRVDINAARVSGVRLTWRA
ncbi:hypothetical protein [Marichromatium sp. AB31]|uniref:hypothetical protein n=1 Tax=Marichromatium sp. AB31 TaxID=2483362 RepID=UPI0011CDA990|nr:hypothetical protein [Marichromatium sp. AB31]